MKIACLGWGSLVWDSRNFPAIGGWKADGPPLPLEFARQSADGRIILVIVGNEAGNPVFWTKLEVDSLTAAIDALAKREGVRRQNVIGRWPSTTTESYPHSGIIGKWAAPRGIEGVVWTALPPGMKASRGVTPTLAELQTYISNLDSETRAKAAEYIFNAPAQIETPYRRLLEMALGHEQVPQGNEA